MYSSLDNLILLKFIHTLPSSNIVKFNMTVNEILFPICKKKTWCCRMLKPMLSLDTHSTRKSQLVHLTSFILTHFFINLTSKFSLPRILSAS